MVSPDEQENEPMLVLLLLKASRLSCQTPRGEWKLSPEQDSQAHIATRVCSRFPSLDRG